jgi:putative tryptophan/tyrosine transport system substrate-binding protein
MIKRREIFSIVGMTAVAWPLGALTQKPPVRIGVLAAGIAASPYGAGQINALKQGLLENGLIEGRDYVLEARFAVGDYERASQLAHELAQAGARVILATTIASVRAAQALIPPLPVVMTGINAPVEAGLIASLARPGGHTTGMATLNEDLTPKLVEIQRESLPSAKTIAALINPANPSNVAFVDKLRVAANSNRMTVSLISLKSPEQLDSVFTAFGAQRPDGLMIVADSALLDLTDRIAALALAHRLPTFSTISECAEFGYLLSYGISAFVNATKAANYVKMILNGANPGELSVEQPTKIEMVINLKTAKALGLAVPEALLARADKLIE